MIWIMCLGYVFGSRLWDAGTHALVELYSTLKEAMLKNLATAQDQADESNKWFTVAAQLDSDYHDYLRWVLRLG
jgi:hypothetical protein